MSRKAKPKDFSGVHKMDWARLSAYIDGEGCISIHNVSGKRYRGHQVCRVSLFNKDPRLPVWCLYTFGGNICNGKRGYEWSLNVCDIASVLKQCLPFFFIKRQQAELAIVFMETKTLYHRWHIIPDEVRKEREQAE